MMSVSDAQMSFVGPRRKVASLDRLEFLHSLCSEKKYIPLVIQQQISLKNGSP